MSRLATVSMSRFDLAKRSSVQMQHQLFFPLALRSCGRPDVWSRDSTPSKDHIPPLSGLSQQVLPFLNLQYAEDHRSRYLWDTIAMPAKSQHAHDTYITLPQGQECVSINIQRLAHPRQASTNTFHTGTNTMPRSGHCCACPPKYELEYSNTRSAATHCTSSATPTKPA
jgi:hypothetical protein